MIWNHEIILWSSQKWLSISNPIENWFCFQKIFFPIWEILTATLPLRNFHPTLWRKPLSIHGLGFLKPMSDSVVLFVAVNILVGWPWSATIIHHHPSSTISYSLSIFFLPRTSHDQCRPLSSMMNQYQHTGYQPALLIHSPANCVHVWSRSAATLGAQVPW